MGDLIALPAASSSAADRSLPKVSIFGPGTRIAHVWQGRTEEVVVEHHGFRWNGSSYPSLSAVALAMTGSRRNGPQFFGLRAKKP